MSVYIPTLRIRFHYLGANEKGPLKFGSRDCLLPLDPLLCTYPRSDPLQKAPEHRIFRREGDNLREEMQLGKPRRLKPPI